MTPLSFGAGVAAFTASCALSTFATAAPSITFVTESPARSSPNGAVTKRGIDHNPNGINYLDCVNDVSLEFSLAVTNLPTTDAMQVWVGTDDCTLIEARNAALGGTCQPVTAAITLESATMKVVVRARDLAAVRGQPSPSPTGGLFTTWTTAADDASCRAQTTSAGLTLGLYVLTFAVGVNDASRALVWSPTDPRLMLLVDTVGPRAPVAGTAEGKPGAARLTWQGSDDPDTNGYRFFCAPASGGCANGPFASDADGRAVGAEYFCGESGDKTASQATIPSLSAGQPYSFAVAGVDISENVSALAAEGCATPSPPAAANTKSGCALAAAPLRAEGLAGALFALGVTTLMVARRRSGSTRRFTRGRI